METEANKVSATSYQTYRKYAIYATWIYCAYMAFMLLYPKPPLPPVPFEFMLNYLHLGAFGVLGILVGSVIVNWAPWKWYLLLLGWSFISEFLQILTGRYFEWNDIINNVIGVTLGFWILVILKKRFVKFETPTIETDE